MEFLEGETEARYAWDTAAAVARCERRARIAAQVRPIAMRSAPSIYKDPRTGRERFEEFFPRPTLADYPPGWQPCSARQLHDAMEAGWKPRPPPPHSAFALFTMQSAGY
jgi:hypothetical protein